MTCDIEDRFAFPWFRQGLPFQCTQCGRCCTGSPGYIWVTEEEMMSMAHLLNLQLPEFKRLYVRRVGDRFSLVQKKSQNHSCVFYQDRQCKVYSERPLQCRSYPFWKENLASNESWERTAEECEGIQSGSPLVPFETIKHLLDEQQKQHPDECFVPNTDG